MNIKIQVLESELRLKPEGFDFYSLNPIQKLDAVLESLELYSETVNNIQRILRLKLEPATLYEVQMILNKLIKDGYAEELKSVVADRLKVGAQEIFYSYKITFEGDFLKSSGGYQELQNQKNAENIRLDKIESHQMEHRRWMNRLTLILAVSAVATVIYYGVELYWKYGWFR